MQPPENTNLTFFPALRQILFAADAAGTSAALSFAARFCIVRAFRDTAGGAEGDRAGTDRQP
jgi:cobalamin synthase